MDPRARAARTRRRARPRRSIRSRWWARGAAIFAGGQRIELVGEPPKLDRGVARVHLAYDAQGPTPAPVSGRVELAEGVSARNCVLEIRESRGRWTSGRITLGDDGTFSVRDRSPSRSAGRTSCSSSRKPGATRSAVEPAQFSTPLGGRPAGNSADALDGHRAGDGRFQGLLRKGGTAPRSKTSRRITP